MVLGLESILLHVELDFHHGYDSNSDSSKNGIITSLGLGSVSISHPLLSNPCFSDVFALTLLSSLS